MSSVVGLNPPRSLTGLGSFGRGDFDAAIPLRISSAIVSLSFLCSCTARIFTARMRSSGRSRVVFIASQIPRNLVFCQRRACAEIAPAKRYEIAFFWDSARVREFIFHSLNSVQLLNRKTPL